MSGLASSSARWLPFATAHRTCMSVQDVQGELKKTHRRQSYVYLPGADGVDEAQCTARIVARHSTPHRSQRLLDNGFVGKHACSNRNRRQNVEHPSLARRRARASVPSIYYHDCAGMEGLPKVFFYTGNYYHGSPKSDNCRGVD